MEFDKKTIKYIKPNDIEIEQFKNIYRILENKLLPVFIPTGLYGTFEEDNKQKYFAVYKDENNTNKICIIFYETNNAYIIYLDSTEKGYEIRLSGYENTSEPKFESKTNVEEYISKCSYYLKKELLGRKLEETHGLTKKSRDYYKFSIKFINEIKYTIMAKQTKEYIIEIIVEQNDTIKKITISWNNYLDFVEKKQPHKISVDDNEIKSEYTKGTLLYKEPNKKIFFKNYEQIMKENGVNPNYIEQIRRRTINGVELPPIISKILKDYFEHEIAQFKRSQVKRIINKHNEKTNDDHDYNGQYHIHHHKM